MTVRHMLRRVLGSTPGVRRLYREMRSTRRTSEEALRLATESARAVESLLQSELELKRELAALRALVMGDGAPREADRERVR
ncbi:hypothetical protein [Micromonospora polyrhachis]|uniref:Uncharacterized protein n=1 Tax=Micromonospora polyrhachis TaxID=1282883 RepID=A0A7W7SMD4_9ACTN|nr:hypothetical protein [Micromonospora polyrhachis]MBB4957306.1 hypothetical protein [Micromonospora polyrhachis]